MAEPDDPEFSPTQSWSASDEPPTIPATPPPKDSAAPSSERSPRSGGWVPPEPADLQAHFPLYEIRGILGRGGMGAVYQGWQKSLRRLVAIKILPPALDDSGADFAERFQREAQAMARFSHPGIVAVHDAGETASGLFYFVMEYIDGTDVQKIVREKGALPAEHALAITASVCDALAYAHKRGVIHRDIKPSNIMVDTEGQVKVADFGLAKLANDESAALVTGTHVKLGTPDFMAPEALYGIGKVDHRADLYAVGVMLYQMLTGEMPRGRFDLPSVQRNDLDPRFDKIVDRAMQKNPEKRYSSAAEISDALNEMRTKSRVQSAAELRTPASHASPASQMTVLPTDASDSGVSSPEAADQRPASDAETLDEPQRTPSSPPPIPKLPPVQAPVVEAPVVEAARRKIEPANASNHKMRSLYGTIAAVVLLGGAAAWLFRNSGDAHLKTPSVGNPSATPQPEIPAVSTLPKEAPARDSTPGPGATPATRGMAAGASRAAPFVNGLGMQFVPVPIAGAAPGSPRVLFSIWETRVRDYANFAAESKRKWPKPSFPLEPALPAVNVSWDDAQAYCAWLTERERKAGRLAATERYRLPTDHEWSCAAGIGEREDPAKTPEEKDRQIAGAYPWGEAWPPPRRAGNYSGEEAAPYKSWPAQKILAGYRDKFPTASAVGYFVASRTGLFDLGGNAWEWCEDVWRPGQPDRTLRGASYSMATASLLLSSARYHLLPDVQDDSTGFRCVLEADAR